MKGDLKRAGKKIYAAKMIWRDTARMSTEQGFFRLAASSGGAPGLARFLAEGEVQGGLITLRGNRREVQPGGIDDVQDFWYTGISSDASPPPPTIVLSANSLSLLSLHSVSPSGLPFHP